VDDAIALETISAMPGAAKRSPFQGRVHASLERDRPPVVVVIDSGRARAGFIYPPQADLVQQ
jgi:hypothetical protein